MNSQQQYKSPRTIFGLIKGRIEENIKKKQIEPNIKTLEDLLITIAKEASLSEIDRIVTQIDLYNTSNNEPELKYRIGILSSYKDGVIGCYSNSEDSPYKIKCTNYNDKPSELFDSYKNIHLIGGIIYTIRNIGTILYPDKQCKDMGAVVLMYPYNPIKENPTISIDNDEFKYDNKRFHIEMTCK
jgi:hypothetical protein